MRRAVCRIVALCLGVSTLFCGCNGNEKQPTSSGIVSIYTNICNDGEFFIDNPYARLNFIDFKSMQTAIICPSPNCPHNDPDSCPAFGMMNHPVICGDRLYFFQTSTAFNGGKAVDSTAVYSAELDGTTKKKLCSIDEGIFSHYDRAVLVDDILYFCLTKSSYDQFGQSSQKKEIFLYSYSFTENKFSRLADMGEGISSGNWLYGVFNGEIYISFSYLEKETTPEDFMNSDTAPEFQQILYKYNIADGGLTQCSENISDIQGGWLIKRDADSAIFRNESEKDVTVPYGSDVTIVNNYAFDVVNKTAFDLSSGKQYSLNLKQSDCEIIFFIDESYIIKSLDSFGNNKYAKIAESDLIGAEVK